MMTPTILRTSAFVSDAADFIARAAAAAIAERGRCILSLCGGNTPRPVYARLAELPLPWEKIVITFGDERCVPPDHAQSNYRMAHEALLSRVAIPEANILRMRGELPPEEAAREYAEALHRLAPGEAIPRHDLLLLGLGDDGHTASLFPDTAALAVHDRMVAPNYVPKLDAHRLTVTFPLINAARQIAFLVNDPAKEPVIEAVLSGQSAYPSGQVAPEAGTVTWILGQ
jgi:6-phosphogluconolactonase